MPSTWCWRLRNRHQSRLFLFLICNQDRHYNKIVRTTETQRNVIKERVVIEMGPSDSY